MKNEKVSADDPVAVGELLVEQEWFRWREGMALLDEHSGVSFVMRLGRNSGRVLDLTHDANVGPLLTMACSAAADKGMLVDLVAEGDGWGAILHAGIEDASKTMFRRATHPAHALALALLAVHGVEVGS